MLLWTASAVFGILRSSVNKIWKSPSRQLVSNSVISIGSHFLSYGVIGAVMILLLWIFLTFQIFLLGCVFSYVYAHLFGGRRREVLN